MPRKVHVKQEIEQLRDIQVENESPKIWASLYGNTRLSRLRANVMNRSLTE